MYKIFCFFHARTGEHCVKLYDRDGHAQGEYAKGDMYIMDQKNTKGHVNSLTDVHWHPTDRNTFITAALDCTTLLLLAILFFFCLFLADKLLVITQYTSVLFFSFVK